MPRIPRPRLHGDTATVAELDDAVLDGGPLPAELPSELTAVPELLRAAAGPATEAELVGQQAAVAAFIRANGVSLASRTRRFRRPMVLSTLLTTKLAFAAAASAATLGGAAAVAYTGALPAGPQNFAHHTIGAPAADDTGNDTLTTASGDTDTDEDTAATDVEPTAEPTSSPVGPDATGHAAFGLCRAYQAHGSKSDKSVAFRNLATAAGGAGNIAAYCAGIPHPGSTDHPTGKPTAHPSHPTHPSHPSHPTGKPTAHPSHPTHPSHPSHPTGKPATPGAH
jgi:hypothetical protein